MQFVRASPKQATSNIYNQPNINPTSVPPIMPFSKKYIQFKTQIDKNKELNATLNPQLKVVAIEEPKKMKWGQPTWFLFHTIAYKIKDESFNGIKQELFDIIKLICNNLPCPICAEHATAYIKNVNFNLILTKRDLQDFLYNFHNSVNQRKQITSFSYEQLDEKYSKAVTNNIIYHFIHFFQDKQYNIHMIANDLHRNKIISNLKIWFNSNMQHFNL